MSDPKNAEADWAWIDHWAQPDTHWGLTVALPNLQRVQLGEIKPQEAVDAMTKELDKAVKG